MQWIEEILEYCPGVKVRVNACIILFPDSHYGHIAGSCRYDWVLSLFGHRTNSKVSLSIEMRFERGSNCQRASGKVWRIDCAIRGRPASCTSYTSLSISWYVSSNHVSSISVYFLAECSAKHNRGVQEVFYEAARVSISSRSKHQSGCVIC